MGRACSHQRPSVFIFMRRPAAAKRERSERELKCLVSFGEEAPKRKNKRRGRACSHLRRYFCVLMGRSAAAKRERSERELTRLFSIGIPALSLSETRANCAIQATCTIFDRETFAARPRNEKYCTLCDQVYAQRHAGTQSAYVFFCFAGKGKSFPMNIRTCA